MVTDEDYSGHSSADWTPVHPYLVIVRAGSRSLHSEWLDPAGGRGFDLLVSAYDEAVSRLTQPGVFHEFRVGPKVRSFAELIDARADFLRHYRFIALLDDDLSVDSVGLTRCFELASTHDLRICQPSLHPSSHFTFAGLLQNSSYQLRYITYVEMMCPIFRADIFEKIKPLYGLGYESGIDLVWCNIDRPGPKDHAVIDAVSVLHTRSVGSRKADNGFSSEQRYEDHIYAVLKRFSLPWLSCIPYSALRPDGTEVSSRVALFLSSLKLFKAIFQQPDWAVRARHVAVHWKHLLFRKPTNLSVNSARISSREGVTV